MYLIQPTRHISSFWQKKDYTHFRCLDKFAASQPLGYESCLEHPRGTCTRRNFWRQNRRHGDGDIEGDDGQMTVLSSHVQAVWKWFFENVKNTCIEWLSAWSFSKYVKPPPRFLPFHKDLFFFAPFWCLFLNQAFQTVLNLCRRGTG